MRAREDLLANHSRSQERHDDRGESHFGGTPLPGLTVADPDGEQVELFREATGSRADGEHVLRDRGLLGRHGEVAVAAWLLFAELPQTAMPHAHVRVLKYTENERGSGAGLTLDDAGDHIRVEIFPHRIEITSPGRFPRLVDTARPLSTGEIIDAVGSSRPTVTKQLQALRQHGLVRWNGKSARDPRATWSLP